jgi:hypothetical protein
MHTLLDWGCTSRRSAVANSPCAALVGQTSSFTGPWNNLPRHSIIPPSRNVNAGRETWAGGQDVTAEPSGILFQYSLQCRLMYTTGVSDSIRASLDRTRFKDVSITQDRDQAY